MQVEIQHLQSIYRAAHQERKLLLRQQREILMIRQSTAKLQEELHHLTGKKKLTRSPSNEEVIKPKMRQISNATLGSSLAESTRPDVPGDKQNCVQLKNKQNKKYDGFSTENKKTLLQYQGETEEPLSLQQSLSAQSPELSGTEAKKVCDATSQTTGVVCMIKHIINADVPCEVEMSAPCEIHQVDGSQCLKPLGHNSQGTSDEELQLKAFSKGLGSTESLSKSNSFSPSSESATSDGSLPDFQKVSAVWIDVSECSISDFELEVQNGEDTDVSIPEELVYEASPNAPKETPIAINSGRKT
ncbi:hypothetical protein CIB84_012282, partial [Bambusicola thoracicus]